MKRFIQRLAIVIAVLVPLLSAAAFLLLGTESGVRLLAGAVAKRMDEQLTFGSINGHLLDRLQLTDLHLISPAGELMIGRASLAWHPSELLHLHLHIEELAAADITFVAKEDTGETDGDKQEGPLTLPELVLPITVSLDRLELTNARMEQPGEGSSFPTIAQAGLAVDWDSRGMTISRLNIETKQGRVDGSGRINPVGNYPLEFQIDGDLTMESMPAVSLTGTVSGDLESLTVNQQVEGDIQATLNFVFSRLLSKPAWQGKISIADLRPGLFSPGTGGTVTGTLATHGSLTQAELTADLSIRDESAVELNWDMDLDIRADPQTLSLDLKQLRLQHPERQAMIHLSGTVDGNRSFNLDGEWQALQWPMANDPDIFTPEGRLQVAGTTDDYHLTMDTRLHGPTVPESIVQLSSQGDLKGMNVEQLRVGAMEGVIEMSGGVHWAPGISWQFEVRGNDVNPGVLSPDWPGRLNWLIRTEGSLKDEEVNGRLAIDRLDGVLRQLPVGCSGRILVMKDQVAIEDLRFTSGSAAISARGTVAEDATLVWQADIADFGDLIPDGAGTLNGQGTVQGKLRQPRLEFSASADNLRVADSGLAHLDVKGELDLAWKQPSFLDLTARDIRAGGQHVPLLSVHGEGLLDRHSFQLTGEHEAADVLLDLRGGYMNRQWQGTVDKFDIDSKELGKWTLKGTPDLIAGAERAKLNEFCLQRESTAFCSGGSWDPAGPEGKGRVTLDAFPVAWLAPWLPDTLQQVDGLVSFTAQGETGELMRAVATAELSPGSITYILDDYDNPTITHQGGRLNLRIERGEVDADLQLAVDSNELAGKLHSPDLLTAATIEQAQVTGEIRLDADRFDIIPALVPEVNEFDADLDLHFTLAGTLLQPNLDGRGTIQLNQVTISSAGIDLQDTQLNISGSGNRVSLDGEFHSPEGKVRLDGEAVLDSRLNWPARIAVQGENYRLVNLPEIQVTLSPDIVLEKSAQQMKLSGEVVIPKADVLLRDLPAEAQTVSGDVVIKQDITEKKKSSLPLEMDVKLALGKDVHFVGMGLNTFIDGQLAVSRKPGQQMLGSGEFRIEQGTFRAYGQDLDIEQGIISFPGGPLDKPGINLRATRTIGEIVAGIQAIGPAEKPRITTFSTPPMAERDVISYLLFGAPASGSGKGTKLSIGRQINSKLSVSVGTNIKTGDKEIITRYRINRALHAELTTASNSNAADVYYTVEFGGDEQENDEN